MEMTPENVSEWLRVAKDVDAAISEQTMAWYIIDDKNEVESTDYHGWLTWTKTGDPVIIWNCTVQDVKIITAFFGKDGRLFETARVSIEGSVAKVWSSLTWAQARSVHRRQVDELQAC